MKTDTLAFRRAAVANAWLAHLQRSDTGLNGALWQMAVPHQTLAAVIGSQIGVIGKKRCNLGLHCLRQKPARAAAQNIRELIGKVSRLAQGDKSVVLHGVSDPSRVVWLAHHRHDTPPPLFHAVTNFPA